MSGLVRNDEGRVQRWGVEHMKDFCGMGSDWIQCVQTGKEREYVEGLVSRARAAQLARPQQLTNRAVGAPSSGPHPRPDQKAGFGQKAG